MQRTIQNNDIDIEIDNDTPTSYAILPRPSNNNYSFLPQTSMRLLAQYKKEIICSAFSIMSGALYFFVSEAGAHNLKNLFGMHDSDSLDVLIDFLGAGSSFCFATFTYKILTNLTLLPNSLLSLSLSLLAPIAASSFYTAGAEGANDLGLDPYLAIGIGVALYAFRTLSMLDSDVKFPAKAKELIDAWSQAIRNKDFKNMARLLVTLVTALGFSASATDSIYAAANYILRSCGLSNEIGISAACYAAGGLGALGIFPLSMYWTYRGLNQLTFGGKKDEDGVEKDPTDRYTAIGLVATVPVILGSIGSVTSANGKMFGMLGIPASIVRVVSSIIYAMSGGVPGLSTVFRATPQFYSACKSRLFATNSESDEKDETEEMSKKLLA